MSEGNSGVSPQDNPPSFIPSGTRKRRPSGQVPRPSAAGEAVPGAGPQAGVPSRRQTSAGAQGAQSMPAAQDVIPSFTPNSSRRVSGSTRRSASEQDARLQPVSPMQDAASAARRQPRRAAGSTHTISNQPRPGEGAGAQSMFASAQRQGPQSPYGYGMPAAQGGGRGMSGRPAATAMRRKRPVGRIVASVLAALLVVIMLVTFGLWNWVDGHLDKQPWLSDKANTSGTSWLILGSDQRTGEEAKTITGFRTDTILVLTKPNSGTRSLISIPRDTLIYCEYSVPKINSAYGWAGGGEQGMQELLLRVSEIIGFTPDGYIVVDLSIFRQLVDLMGGVTFDVPVDMHYSDPTQNLSIDLQAGKQHLNGEQAMQVARFRSGYATADLGRIEVQRALVSAAIRQWVSPKGAIHLPQAVKLVADHTNTDLSTRNLLWLAESFLLCSRSDIRSATLPGYAANFSSGSYYVLDAAGVADIVNQYLNPYEKGVQAADLFIRNG